jgi:hypothetical protein
LNRRLSGSKYEQHADEKRNFCLSWESDFSIVVCSLVSVVTNYPCPLLYYWDFNFYVRFGLEAEGPMLKLGGTWQFPQQADSISLSSHSSHSSDEGANFTDTDSPSALSGSGISSPLQVCHIHHLVVFVSSYLSCTLLYVK